MLGLRTARRGTTYIEGLGTRGRDQRETFRAETRDSETKATDGSPHHGGGGASLFFRGLSPSHFMTALNWISESTFGDSNKHRCVSPILASLSHTTNPTVIYGTACTSSRTDNQ
jgi:hypothetical protein